MQSPPYTSSDLYKLLQNTNQSFIESKPDDKLFDIAVLQSLKHKELIAQDAKLLKEWRALAAYSTKYYSKEHMQEVFTLQAFKNIKKINAFISGQSLFPQSPCDVPKEIITQDLLPYISGSFHKLEFPIDPQCKQLATVSKGWNSFFHEVSPYARLKKQEEHTLNGRFQTAKLAIESILENNLEVANLKDFQDLTTELLYRLLKEGAIKHLMIKTDHIKELPSLCCQLETLDCSHCMQLISLPENLQLTHLNCSNCPKLKELPKNLPRLVSLDCSLCQQLTKLPLSLSLLRELDCNSCRRLATLGEAFVQLTHLICYDCSRLTHLPSDLPKLEFLSCSRCKELGNLPQNLPQLKHLFCQSCKKLTDLPKDLPELINLNYSGCAFAPKPPEKLQPLIKIKERGCESLIRNR